MRRVVITGMGCVTSIGADVETFWQSLLSGKQGSSEIQSSSCWELNFAKSAQIQDFDASRHLSNDMLKISERSSQFALVAAQQAIAQAAWATVPPSAATIMGCSSGGRTVEEPETAMLYKDGKRVHPLTVPRSMGSSGTALVAMHHGLCGPAYTLNTACASGAHAIGLAFQSVRSGSVNVAVTGGHEAPLTYGFYKAWDSLRVVSKTWCRPFASDRDGMSLGEGAAVLVLESLEYAQTRGAVILGEIVGFGMSCDANHMTQPKSEGAAQAMQAAINDAGISPKQVCYVNAHGTGTKVNDASEAAAIDAVFHACPSRPAVSATKAAHGHAIGASGAIEALATVLALRDGIAPPTAGTFEIDTALQIDLVKATPRWISRDFALSNSFAFGGMNAVLAFQAWR